MTSAAGGVAPPPAVKPCAPLSKLPNAAPPKKGNASAKKNKVADGSGSSKPLGKKLVVRVTGATATEAPAADVHNVFDKMPQSVNDEAYMSTIGVGSKNSHWSQTNDMHFKDHEVEVDEDDEGIVDAPKGRGGNYTNEEDVLLCNTWLQVSRDPSVGGDQSRDAYWNRMKEHFDDDEKWKKRDDIDDLDLSNKRKRTIDLDDDEEEASSDDGKRSPTPNSVSYSKPKRPDGTKKDAKEKKKRKGDDELKNAMEAIVKARKEANEMRKMARNQDAAVEERRLAAEERRVVTEERRVALEERKVGMDERSRWLDWEKHLFFLDTSILNEAQKEYANLAREEVLIQKRAMIRAMGGGGLGGMGGGGLGDMGGMGGFGATMGGMGAMGGFGATMETMGGMGGFGAPPGAMVGMGGMSFASLMGGMGAPPGAMGGMSSDVPHTPSHEDVVEDLANTVRASCDAACDNEEEEEESSSEESDESKEDEDEDEDEA
nr:keratin, type II cytoskeletal 5-like [Aegilops tauschii subsp. strangulata]